MPTKPAHAFVAAWVIAAAATVSAQLLPADEAGAVQTLRFIGSAQIAYQSVCGKGFHAPSLAVLGRPTPGQTIGFILQTNVPPEGAVVLEKYGYRIEMIARPSLKSPADCNGGPAGTLAESYSVTAIPMLDYTGKWYEMNTHGEITEIR